jgi:ribosomal protein S18 acetylase RimI-like enzyme
MSGWLYCQNNSADILSVLYNAISLSVSKGNPAQKLYESLGFEVFAEDETAITMLKFIP